MGMECVVARGILAQLAAEAAHAAPNEACGLLLGRREGREIRVDRLLPTINVAPDPARHFEIDPAALIGAHRAARDGGPQVVGCYHSHPTGIAAPSATDTALAAPDGQLWAIVGAGQIGWYIAGHKGFTALFTREDAD